MAVIEIVGRRQKLEVGGNEESGAWSMGGRMEVDERKASEWFLRGNLRVVVWPCLCPSLQPPPAQSSCSRLGQSGAI